MDIENEAEQWQVRQLMPRQGVGILLINNGELLNKHGSDEIRFMF